MIKLLFLSYIDRKKLMILLIFEVLIMLFMFLIVYEKDATFLMMLEQDNYLTYFNEVFIQVFLIVNAMFVLFLVMDHDQAFLKPLMSYFGRLKVSFNKYICLSLFVILYGAYVIMFYVLTIEILTPLEMNLDIYRLAYMFLDMLILMNFLLILIKHKYKNLSIIIIMIYIFQTLFNETLPRYYEYLFPLFNMTKSYQIVELYYKICYICLGFMVYMQKSISFEL
jgi:hypothetical protein